MSHLSELRDRTHERYAHQPTFLQAVDEVLESLTGDLADGPTTADDIGRLTRLIDPERIITFKVIWSDDQGVMQHNTGYRVQFNSALGPYKGGLRFDPSVNEDILKFLGFEQIFKNALTGLPMGGGKGGSDFNPKGKTDNEIRSFCRAFMTELYRHIGPETDVPAGDMGVGGREIGFMYGMYKQIVNRTEGVLTGKDPLIGGSLGRVEATGHGVVYFAREMLAHRGESLAGLRAVVSGSGNVAEHTARQLLAEGAVVLTLSDRGGYIYKETGFSEADIGHIMAEKHRAGTLANVSCDGCEYRSGKPWQTVVADGYFPCATQNEILADDARFIVSHAKLVVEGANMPLSNEAITVLQEARVLHAPGKAANAGGVAVSGLEMAQNAEHYSWTRARVEDELQAIMRSIHAACVEYGAEDEYVNYVHGANRAAARRVLGAMARLGW